MQRGKISVGPISLFSPYARLLSWFTSTSWKLTSTKKSRMWIIPLNCYSNSNCEKIPPATHLRKALGHFHCMICLSTQISPQHMTTQLIMNIPSNYCLDTDWDLKECLMLTWGVIRICIAVIVKGMHSNILKWETDQTYYYACRSNNILVGKIGPNIMGWLVKLGSVQSISN
jgi:hypothetical protein